MTERAKFEAWFEDQIWGNEDFKTCLLEAWQARAVLASQQKPVAGLDEVAEKVWRERAWLERPELVQFRDAVRAVVAELTNQEPVAWMDREGDVMPMPVIENWCEPHTLLYAAPIPAVPTGWKLVGWLDGRGRFFYADDPMYKNRHEGMREVFAAAPEVKS